MGIRESSRVRRKRVSKRAVVSAPPVGLSDVLINNTYRFEEPWCTISTTISNYQFLYQYLVSKYRDEDPSTSACYESWYGNGGDQQGEGIHSQLLKIEQAVNEIKKLVDPSVQKNDTWTPASWNDNMEEPFRPMLVSSTAPGKTPACLAIRGQIRCSPETWDQWRKELRHCVIEFESCLNTAFKVGLKITNQIVMSPDFVVWHLQDSPVAPERQKEKLRGRYPREEVPLKHIRVDGKFRGIVRLVLYYRSGLTGDGTGWLMSSDTVATAGHCVYDSDGDHLVSVEVIRGYPEVCGETRKGQIVAANWPWCRSFASEHDLALIRVDSPFTPESALKWQNTPKKLAQGEIAGFPADKKIPSNKRGRMFYNKSDLKLATRQNGYKYLVIEHNGDSEGGTSESPKEQILFALR
ncbi:hypothetical protein F5Y13DRAFT_165278 [Hypoxylon sp. FL1857]|nr:hypothetical protein F5Y13DRAFT_165278 [Hypoxylon sp. FL1857]